uniref:SET domain-containing protein n=1 Tax=Fagus sylvatica TaxID=28930 RepID=A0A2N9ET24_FAGSY
MTIEGSLPIAGPKKVGSWGGVCYYPISYNRLGRDAEEADALEIIDMASKASLADQQKQVQENIHAQIKSFSMSMDEILLPDTKRIGEAHELPPQPTAPRRSGLGFAVGRNAQPTNHPVVPETRPLKRVELSERLKDLIGYKLDIKPSQIPHKEAGQGLYLDGEADVGTVVALYPGVIYSPAYYRYIPGYPRVNAQNTYLITRYDGTVINAQPWGLGGETREVWNGLSMAEFKPDMQGVEKGSDRFWKLLNSPMVGTQAGLSSDILERRNPLAFAHYANHPANSTGPNVMVCPYDFPLAEKDMRAYIPNILFGNAEEVKMKRFGSFWFKLGSSGNGGSSVPVLKTLVLVATRALNNEEVLLNYRLSNSKRRPAWYTPVDEEEDRRRWS